MVVRPFEDVRKSRIATVVFIKYPHVFEKPRGALPVERVMPACSDVAGTEHRDDVFRTSDASRSACITYHAR